MSVTNRLSDRELWESWKPFQPAERKGVLWSAETSLGSVSIESLGLVNRLMICLEWDSGVFFASSEEEAIGIVVESYKAGCRRIIEGYVKGLKVDLGAVDEHGYVHTHTSTYTIRKGVELICDRNGREIGRLDTYVLWCGDRKIDKNSDYHVWEEKVTEAYQYELLKALNLR